MFQSNYRLMLAVTFLPSSMHSGTLPERAGISTCVNLRPKLKTRPVDYSITRFFSALDATADVAPSMTLRQIGRVLRENKRRREKDGQDFASMKYWRKVQTGPRFPGVSPDVTNRARFE
jgi:hypothetical protein